MIDDPPPALIARVTGALYLGTIVAGLYAEIGSLGSLIVGGDPAATGSAILAHQALSEQAS